MYTCKGRFSILEELTTKNDNELFLLMKENAHDYRFLISDEDISTTYRLFQERLYGWFNGGRMYQFLVRKKNGQNAIGTIFFYCHDTLKREVKLSAFFTPEVRKTLCVAESLAESILFAKRIIDIEAVCFSVYAENNYMLKIANKLKAALVSTSTSTLNPQRQILMYRLTPSSLESITDKLQILSR